MDEIIKQGQLLFAVAVMASGTEQLICARFGLAARYIIPWVPGNSFLAYVIGIALLAAGLSIVTNKRARLSAFLVGFMFLLCCFAHLDTQSSHRPTKRIRSYCCF